MTEPNLCHYLTWDTQVVALLYRCLADLAYVARIAIVTWIGRTYHRRRRQAALGRLAPIEYETIMTHAAAHAA